MCWERPWWLPPSKSIPPHHLWLYSHHVTSVVEIGLINNLRISCMAFLVTFLFVIFESLDHKVVSRLDLTSWTCYNLMRKECITFPACEWCVLGFCASFWVAESWEIWCILHTPSCIVHTSYKDSCFAVCMIRFLHQNAMCYFIHIHFSWTGFEQFLIFFGQSASANVCDKIA